MEIFLLSFLVMAASVAGLAFGVLKRKRPVRAGCGGPEEREGECEACGGADRSP